MKKNALPAKMKIYIILRGGNTMTKYIVSWFKTTEGGGVQGPFTRNCKQNSIMAYALVDKLQRDPTATSIELKTIDKFDKIVDTVDSL